MRKRPHTVRISSDDISAECEFHLTTAQLNFVVEMAKAFNAKARFSVDPRMEVDPVELKSDVIGLGNGVVMETHPPSACKGEFCCVHNPSDHPLSSAPLNWRGDRGLMERICQHGIGHPDPDDLAHKRRVMTPAQYDAGAWGVHGCCGKCCRPSSAAHPGEVA